MKSSRQLTQKEIQTAKNQLKLLFPENDLSSIIGSLSETVLPTHFEKSQPQVQQNSNTNKRIPKKQIQQVSQSDQDEDQQSSSEQNNINIKQRRQESAKVSRMNQILAVQYKKIPPTRAQTYKQALFRQQMQMQAQRVEMYGKQLKSYNPERVDHFVNNSDKYFNLDSYYADQMKRINKPSEQITYDQIVKYKQQRFDKSTQNKQTMTSIKHQLTGESQVNQIQDMKHFFSIQNTDNIFYYNTAVRIEKSIMFDTKNHTNFNGQYPYRLQKDCVKLFYLKLILSTYIEKGYSIRDLRNKLNFVHITKNRYKTFMYSIIRVCIRLMQKYIKEECGKGFIVFEYRRDIVGLTSPLFRIHDWFEPEYVSTFYKLLKLIFLVKESQVDYLSKKQIIDFYFTCEKKICRKENMKQLKNRPIPIKTTPNLIIDYFPYSAFGQRQISLEPFQKGIIQKFVVVCDFFDQISLWTELFQIQFIKLLLKYKRIITVRQQLLQLYKQIKSVKQEFAYDNLKIKIQKTYRKIIKFLQVSYRKLCRFRKIEHLSFNQMKFLKLNDYQKRTFSSRKDGVQVKQMMLDYYLNNMAKLDQNGLQIQDTKIDEETQNFQAQQYRMKYINLIIQAFINYLQTKRHLQFIMQDPDEDKMRTYYLNPNSNHKWIQENQQKNWLKDTFVPGKIVNKKAWQNQLQQKKQKVRQKDKFFNQSDDQNNKAKIKSQMQSQKQKQSVLQSFVNKKSQKKDLSLKQLYYTIIDYEELTFIKYKRLKVQTKDQCLKNQSVNL